MSAYVVSEIVTILHQNYPINTGLLAEIMAFGATEVVVRPEGFIESGDQVKERLPAALVRERTLPIIQTLTQSESKTYFTERAMTFWKTCIVCKWGGLWLTCWGWFLSSAEETEPPAHAAAPPDKTA